VRAGILHNIFKDKKRFYPERKRVERLDPHQCRRWVDRFLNQTCKVKTLRKTRSYCLHISGI